jgi:hypothetical protein
VAALTVGASRLVAVPGFDRWVVAVADAKGKGALLAASAGRTRGVAGLEAAVCGQADAVWAITPGDAARIATMIGDVGHRHNRVFLVPVTVAPAPASEAPGGASFRGFKERAGFLFVGTGQNPTNVAACRWFLRDVWPLLRAAVPGAHLTIAGTKPPSTVKGKGKGSVSWDAEGLLATSEGQRSMAVRVVGFVKDLRPLLDTARVFVSPVTVASGFNTKNLLALGRGLPLVTTAEGAAGLPPGAAAVSASAGGSGRASASSFAELAAGLHANATAWAAQGAAGYGAAAGAFSASAVRQAVTSAVAASFRSVAHHGGSQSRSSAQAPPPAGPRTTLAAGPFVFVLAD